MFPVQTVMIRYWLDVEVMTKHGGFGGVLASGAAANVTDESFHYT